MGSSPSVRTVLLGVLAGLLTTPAMLLLAYVTGIVVIGVHTKDVFVTLLTAGTVLPLMLIFVLFIPTLLIGLSVGVITGFLFSAQKRMIGVVGALIGCLISVLTLSVLLPLIIVPHEQDFTSIVSNYFVSGLYGIVLGAITARLLRWFHGE